MIHRLLRFVPQETLFSTHQGLIDWFNQSSPMSFSGTHKSSLIVHGVMQLFSYEDLATRVIYLSTMHIGRLLPMLLRSLGIGPGLALAMSRLRPVLRQVGEDLIVSRIQVSVHFHIFSRSSLWFIIFSDGLVLGLMRSVASAPVERFVPQI